jgi:hypothetical protein
MEGREGFLRTVYATALLLAAALMPFFYRLGHKWALGLALGAGLAILLLKIQEHTAAAIVAAGPRRGKKVALAVAVVKWPAVVAVLYLATTRKAVSPAALCVGIGVVPAAALLSLLVLALKARVFGGG